MTKVEDLSYTSEGELVQAALDFANLRTLRSKSSKSRPARYRLVTLRIAYRRLRLVRSKEETDQAIRVAHTWLCRALTYFAKEQIPPHGSTISLGGRARFGKLEWWLPHVMAAPYVTRGRLDYRIAASSVGGLCAYAVALIPERPGYHVRRCKLDDCAIFFWAKTRGGRYLEYCCPRHKRWKHGQ